MTDSREKIIDKIRSLLAMAGGNSGASENEALKAARAAAKLMDQYEIDEKEVDGKNSGSYTQHKAVILFAKGYHQYYYRWVIKAIGDYTGTAAVYIRKTKTNDKEGCAFFGNETDVILAEFIATATFSYVEIGADADFAKLYPFGSGPQKVEFKRGYYRAAAARVALRIREMIEERSQARSASQLPALVDRARINMNALALVTDVDKASDPDKREYNLDAMKHGFERGKTAPIGTAIEAKEKQNLFPF